MGTPIRILMVEDSPEDAALLTAGIQGGGFEPAVERVDRPESLFTLEELLAGVGQALSKTPVT